MSVLRKSTLNSKLATCWQWGDAGSRAAGASNHIQFNAIFADQSA